MFKIVYKKSIFVVLVSGIFFAASASDYKLMKGDIISVTIFGESELSIKKFVIPRTGTITMQLIGVVEIGNKTIKEAEKLITDKYQDGYLKMPKVTIAIESFRPIFVNGEVRNPGTFTYLEGLTVRKAIALAGGLTDRASLRKINLVREGTDEIIDVAGVLDETQVYPGDVITIGESLF